MLPPPSDFYSNQLTLHKLSEPLFCAALHNKKIKVLAFCVTIKKCFSIFW